MFDLLFIGAGVILLATCLYLNRRRWTRGFRAWLFLLALPLTVFLLVMLTVVWITVAKFWK